MNTDLLLRATFVLDRVTAERLTAISSRLGLSRSALVRDVLAEPVALMHTWVASLPPDDVTREDVNKLLGRIETDFAGWVDSKSAQLDLLGEVPSGNT